MDVCDNMVPARARNSVWAITLFRDKRKSSQQNVLKKIVLGNDEIDENTNNYYKRQHPDKGFLSLLCSSKWTKLFLEKGFCGLIFGLIFSTTVAYHLWLTSWFHGQVLNALVLENNSIIFNFWRDPPVQPFISIYIFNYTNHEEAMNGIEKPRVEEVGPYTFSERMERVNIKFHSNGTISYQEKRTYTFVRELSVGDLQDRVITPNIPLITAADFSRGSMLTRAGLRMLAASTEARPLHDVTVHDFVWGLNDSFANKAAEAALLLQKPVPSAFGILSTRNGISQDVITIYSGTLGFDNFGIINRYNGRDRMDTWQSDCNSLVAGDGSLYPPYTLQSKKPIYIYTKEFCRRIPLIFEKNAEWTPALRYKNPSNVFSSPESNPDNSCFCIDSQCAPEGLQNTKPCSYGAPVYISFPHFLLADEKLHSDVLGLKPDPKIHSTHIDIHENLGFPIGGVTRVQMNIRVSNPAWFATLRQLDDDIYLPICWLQCGVDKLPTDIYRILFHATYSLRFLEIFLMWSSVLMLLLCMYLIWRRCRLLLSGTVFFSRLYNWLIKIITESVLKISRLKEHTNL
ncbi:lysosome membrane protein 2 [Nilaparvata lugens]|uniref:lysosome membrane protein 2 n=1 Tax=Nilaparvata lugens TaxID=108931 RepID=UPI00193EB0B7|nr:lysosome membrane protein 2 [Nilaparvata lugens]